MKKAYCDKCGVEIIKENKFNNFEVKVQGVAFGVEIEDAIPTEYDVCKYCVFGAIAAHDDRPRSAQPYVQAIPRRRNTVVAHFNYEERERNMVQKVMICGVDCRPGDANCNNYCNHDKSKPMADHSPAATPEVQLASARRIALEKLREAEKAWYEYFGMCEVGQDRERAAQVYENVRTATRL